MKRKLLGIMLAMCTIMTTVTGCGSSSNASSGNSSKAQNVKQESDKKSFTYWVPMKPTTAKFYTDLNDHIAAPRLEEKTGIKVDYISPNVGNEKTEMNLMLASGDNLPDLMSFNFNTLYKGGVDTAISDGVLLDATDIIKNNAPNFMKFINSDEDFKKGAFTDKGTMAYFGSVLPEGDMKKRTFNGPLVNKNLLDKAGLKVPETIADWEVMLAKFKEMGVEIPFDFASNNTLEGIFGVFSGAYGVSCDPANNFINVDGTVKFSPVESGYKDFLQLFAKWYANGWLNPDFLARKGDKSKSDVCVGKVGSVIGHTTYINNAAKISVQKGMDQIDMVAAPYPVVNKGDKLHLRQHVQSFNKTPCFISAKAENPTTIVKWVDWLYSPEGMNELDWGVKGDSRFEDTYFTDEDGQNHLTEEIKGTPGLNAKYTMTDLIAVWDWNYQKTIYTNFGEKEPYALDCWKTWENSADYAYEMPQTLTMTQQENEEFSKIMADVSTYVSEQSVKFIMGKTSFDTYDTFLKTLKDMNIDRAIKIQQDALDRYNKR